MKIIRTSAVSLFKFLLVLSILLGLGIAEEKKVTRISCVGDSITAGWIKDLGLTYSYPAQLGRMLGSDYVVGNFGKNGATLLNAGNIPYQKNAAFTKAMESNPDIVIIKLGTNDSKPGNWKFKDQYIPDYKDLIGKFKALPSTPKIYLCYPLLVAPPGKFGISEENVQEEMKFIDQIAKDEGLEIINLHTLFIGQESLLMDTVHPTAEGYGLMAKVFYKLLKGEDFVGEIPPAPSGRGKAPTPAKESSPDEVLQPTS